MRRRADLAAATATTARLTAVRIAAVRITAAAGLAALALVGCTSVSPGRGTTKLVPSTATASVATSEPTLPPTACPASYAPPDPNRPRAALTFILGSDLSSARGTEHIVFTPDEPITELVFRLTANTAPTVAEGNKIVVTAAHADHDAGSARYTRSGASADTQGGLLHIPFPATIPAGTTVTADLAFTITLGSQSFDRFGRTGSGAGRFAWFGTAQPLLAWERGFGWHTEDMIQFTAESATSEAMDTALSVTAPAADTVIMSGDPVLPAASGGTRTWRSTIAAARDVSVAIGPFAVTDTVVQGVHLRIGAYTTGLRDQLVPEFVRAIDELSARFGPFPFPSLSVARLPASGGGIEYPSSILMLDGSRLVAVHETAHQWFYAMVGDSQALHPWMDEAFAVYAEELVNGDEPPLAGELNAPGTVDHSTESYGSAAGDYYFVTYNKGSAALLTARAAAGPAAWDKAMHCYLNRNAWRIANPSDFAAAIATLPKGVAVLTKAGALP